MTTHTQGYNIYLLQVPIVAPNVLISAGGSLSLTSRRLMQLDGPRFLQDASSSEPTNNVVHSELYTGSISSEAENSTSANATTY